MTATNHVLAGTVITAVLPTPVGLGLALLSHVILDALPHLGVDNHTSNRFLYILMVDSGAAAAVLLSVLLIMPANAWWIITGGILAASPDLLWLPHWIRELRGQPARRFTPLENFLSRVQWGERSWGWLIEIPFTGLLLYLLLRAIY